MILHLAFRGYGIGLDLPTTRDNAASTISRLKEGFEDEPAQVNISGVNGPVSNLYPYIQHADLECWDDLQKLNTLAEQTGSMTQEEQRIFSGALELECTEGLDDAIRIAGSLERYEIFPKIKTDEDLGRFLVDTAFMTGKFSFPEEAKPYLDQLIPTDCVNVEAANEMAHCLRRIKKDGEMMKYCAVLEVEEPSTFSEALDMAIDLDDYELVSDNEREYGREALRRLGADGELLDTIDGYTDFDQLGRAMMEGDGVRQTGYGLVRRLSKPFPPEPAQNYQMGGQI